MKRHVLFTGMIALAMSFTTAKAQLYSYTNNLGGAPASTAANTTGSNLGRVNGTTLITGCPDGFNSNRFAEATTFGVNRPAIEFTISPNTGYQLDVTSVSVDARRNNKGPVTWRFAYSTDGGATWTNNGSDYSVTAITCGTTNNLVWDMPDFSSEGSVMVRVYAYAALSSVNGVGTLTNLTLSGSVSYADIDNDGYTSDVDCDDFNAAINPGASESCNGIDDNCDGNIDEGVQNIYFADADGDTYGDAGNTTLACSLPAGYVENSTDCNDGDAAINPGASEVCNGIDDNCDGNADEGLTFDTWYADADGDTYGDAGNSVSTCDGAPAGYVADNTDCNDGDAAINPGATEVCNGIDDNCDGNIDEGLTFDTWYTDADGDTYGDAGMSVSTCDGAPAGYVADNTDCNDADAAVNPGATEVCNGVDDNCDGNTDEGVTTTFYADADGDTYGDAASTTEACSAPAGYVSDNTDCNDADAAVNPGATEVCNGVDDNCDGNTDEGVTTTFYADADGDTYGDAASTTEACSAPAGYVSDNTDCNDADGAINPGATEVCNGIDDNCDGNIDEGVTTIFYADADGDTYGDAASTTEACSAPAGYVSDNTDCNDTDGSVNPGATEVCNGIDDNCDGNIDEGVTTTFYADADGDTYGDAASTTEACSAPAGYVSDNTDCNDADGSVNPGATEVCNGVDDNCDGNIDEGVLITFYADADGDTYGDAASTTEACSAPAGYVADNTDCNDVDGAINPGATEVCNGVDDNCDGNIDEGVLITFYADADGDAYGDDAMTAEACSAPAGYVAAGGDCNDASNTVYPGAPEICGNGIDEDCDGVIDLTATIAADGPTTLCFGETVTLNSTTAGAGLSYQWQKNGVNIAGATNSSYVVTKQGNYRCIVTKPSCSSTSAPIGVTVNLTPNAFITALDGLDLCGLPNVRLRGNNAPGYTYQWYLDGSPIAGATNILYYATATGSYQVQVTNASGCSNMSPASVVFSSCRMAEGEVMADINVMPNPNKGVFDIQFQMNTNTTVTARVMVMNLAGQTVASFDAEVVGGALQYGVEIAPVAGAYLLVVQVDGAVYTERLIITE